MVDRKVFRDFFSRASLKQVYLIDSKYSGESIYTLSQKYKLDTEKDILLCRNICDIILGFYKIEDTVPLLQQELGLDAKTAALLGADVLDFLAPLSDPNFVVPIEEDQGEDTVIDRAEEVKDDSPLAWTPSQASTEPVPSPYAPTSNVAPEIHTMASDASRARANFEPVVEQVHTSEQPAIRKNLSETPSYAIPFKETRRDTILKAPIEPPRWGS